MTTQISKSAVEIGPISFTYQVQDISIQEEKSVKILPATRTSKNFIADAGNSNQKAVIRLLITGTDEINSELRKLIALFRSCPIVSIYNELISSSWRISPNLVESQLAVNPDNGALIGPPKNATTKKSGYVPVALEELSISSVPDVPYSLFVTLVVTRVDISSIYPEGELLYQKESSADPGSPYPVDAYYLSKWLDMCLAKNTIPFLVPGDFANTQISWYGAYFTDEKIDPNVANLTTIKLNSDAVKIQSESCSIRNIFAYKNLIGKGVPFVQHMGSTAKYYSMDLLFYNQQSNKEFDDFCNFKETADKIAKATERDTRVVGWIIEAPIAKLLSEPSNGLDTISPKARSDSFVPLHVSIDTASSPMTKAVRIDLAETNIDYQSESSSILLNGGSDYNDLKKYYNKLVEREFLFRTKIRGDAYAFTRSIIGSNMESTSLYDAYETFWPVINGNLDISYTEKFGILNRDTLKAVMLSRDYDVSERLAIALEGTPIISGKINLVNSKLPGILTRMRYGASNLLDTLFGVGEDEYRAVYDIIKDLVESMFDLSDYTTTTIKGVKPFTTITIPSIYTTEEETLELSKIINYITRQMFIAMFGEYSNGLVPDLTNSSGEIVSRLAGSKLKFSKRFTDALFEVIVKRLDLGRPNLQKIYSSEGIHAAFFKLIVKYSGDIDYIESSEKSESSTSLNSYFNKTVYEDLYLPKYKELYGDEWESFAPTYDDLGLINAKGNTTQNQTAEDRQAILAVDENDTVPPSAWFSNKKYKPLIVSELSDANKSASNLGSTLHISLPFEVKDVEEIENLTEKINATGTTDEESKRKLRQSLSEVISRSFERARTNYRAEYDAFLQDMSTVSLDQFSKEYQGQNISLYVHHMDNHQRKKYLTVPGVAAEIYKFASETRILRPNDRLSRPINADAGYRNGERANEFEFIRSLKENNEACIRSDISQMADIYESTIKMFPAIKVYLLEQRGTDLYGNDTFFSVNPILSVDITMDKDDADLAVIQIADPLYILQNSFFPGGGVTEVKNQDGSTSKRVLGNLQGTNVEGYLKRYKITEGRAVQIRLGYDSMPKNLKTVFTGRIVEISPGDTLTLVCQGWKTELINRQVNFYNDNVKNWGARDLAIMTMQNANPDGFGDVIPQMLSDYAQQAARPDDINDIVSQIRTNQTDVDTTNGNLGFFAGIGSSIKEFFGTAALGKDNKGLDTRLKNIWWPDLATHNNFVGWRNWTEVMPSQINDSWIVPLQPAWEVFKEASRHAWNSVVSVVPYDGRATLFFGHPDQPYYFTKSSPKQRQRLQNYRKLNQKITISYSKIVDGFFNSKYYDDKHDTRVLDNLLEQARDESFSDHVSFTDTEILTDLPKVFSLLGKAQVNYSFYSTNWFERQSLPFRMNVDWTAPNSCYKTLALLIRDQVITIVYPGIEGEFVKSYRGYCYDLIRNSALPLSAFENLQAILGSNTVPLLLYAMFQIPPGVVNSKWASAELDFPRLLSPGDGISSEEQERLLENLKSSVTVDLPTYRQEFVKIYSSFTDSVENGLVGVVRYRQTDSPESIKLLSTRTHSKRARIVFGQIKRNAPAKFTELSRKFVELIDTLEENYLDYIKLPYSKRSIVPDTFSSRILPALPESDSIQSTKKAIKMTIDELASTEDNLAFDETLKDATAIKLFVYFFNEYLRNAEPDIRADAEDLKGTQGILPPNMQVFRQHLWIDSDHDILKNNIVASTKDMWNTVSVEHPGHAEAISKVTRENLYKSGEFYSGINWKYWPKREVSGVIGLQFHPGLTLSNKKIKVFTELNCQSEELAAKLACTHLADGLRRMYRGNLMVVGRHIKPHDRIILNDKYNNMGGPLEVESVIHHWSVETGWITNIGPQAVCDANPGAAVIQTAALEDTFSKVFKTIDFVSDVISIAIIIASLGTGAPVAAGTSAIAAGAKATLKQLFSKSGGKFIASRLKAAAGNAGYIVGSLRGALANKSPTYVLGNLVARYGDLGFALLKNYSYVAGLRQLTYSSYRMLTTSSFVSNAQKTQQLPVILNPMTFNGLPFLAGLNTDDPIWLTPFNDFFYSSKDLNKGAEQILKSFSEDSPNSVFN